MVLNLQTIFNFLKIVKKSVGGACMTIQSMQDINSNFLEGLSIFI